MATAVHLAMTRAHCRRIAKKFPLGWLGTELYGSPYLWYGTLGTSHVPGSLWRWGG